MEMETYFQGFHEDEQFSANLLLSDIDEVMKDQLVGLKSFRMEETWGEENETDKDKEDFQQIMSDWQQHLGSFNSTESEDLGLGLDTNLDILSNYSNCDFFGELESPILSKALKYPGQIHNNNYQPTSKTLASTIATDSFCENLGSCNKSHDKSQKLTGLVKAEPSIIRKFTLINGEKEILGKSIIGLHCLNEIKENPDENCQVTSTVINGKRYKIIIKPKSLRVKKLSEEKITKTIIKKLTQCHLVTKTKPEENQITSEVCSDNFDVPIINTDLLPSRDFSPLDSDMSNQGKSSLDTLTGEIESKPEKKVPSVKVKLTKLKNSKNKLFQQLDKDNGADCVSNEVVKGQTLGSLLKNFEEEVAKLEKNDSDDKNDKSNSQKTNLTSENIKNCLPREMVNKIEALKHQKQCRIPLIQAMPTKKLAKNGTRMQDAVATMNRNKLLKIVSAGDSVQLDHDYCSTFTKQTITKKELKKNTDFDTNLVEKNPKKDSGMESGDVSDASEGPTTPECSQILPLLRQINNKVLGDHRREGDHSGVSKAAIASNFATVHGNSSSDSVKTKTVSNGNKTLTNDGRKSNRDSDNSCTVSSESVVKGINDDGGDSASKGIQKSDVSLEQCSSVPNERPKKKLKLEEYLSRRTLKQKETEQITNPSEIEDIGRNAIEFIQNNEKDKSEKTCRKDIQEKTGIVDNKNKIKKENKEKKFWRTHSRRSSSGSSRERRTRSRSVSGSRWRSGSNCSNGRRGGREKQRRRRSVSRERKSRGFWSGSLSRSSSRESSTSSDVVVSKRCKYSSARSRRRSRSRSVSWGRSAPRNRGNNRRRTGNFYYNKKFNYRRSKSPCYAYSMREKQRQIEERRVIYVGRIEEGMTNAKLRERFSIFGPIIDISLHFREYGDNYGFVTYAYKGDAYDAVEHGNDDPSLPRYDLCFGGRRGFCKEKYADLDGMPTSYSGFNDTFRSRNSQDSFDLLLKEAQAKLKNRKKQ